jgi:mannose/cellobiose epimerase-like protein (N-acyl-D-glucosamine 2-epimerase family)
MLVLSSAVLRKGDGACTESHQADWTPSEATAASRISYGHDVEGGWLLLESCDALGVPVALLTDHAATMIATMLRYGFDHRHGGVFAGGPMGRAADDRRKIWWVQAEALVASPISTACAQAGPTRVGRTCPSSSGSRPCRRTGRPGEWHGDPADGPTGR